MAEKKRKKKKRIWQSEDLVLKHYGCVNEGIVCPNTEEAH